jgi:hypothetical protein
VLPVVCSLTSLQFPKLFPDVGRTEGIYLRRQVVITNDI